FARPPPILGGPLPNTRRRHAHLSRPWTRFASMELEVSEQLALLCDTRLEGGPEGFTAALDELSQEEVESLFGEAIDALRSDTARAGAAKARRATRQQPLGRRLAPGQAGPGRRPLSPEPLGARIGLLRVGGLLLHARAVALGELRHGVPHARA